MKKKATKKQSKAKARPKEPKPKLWTTQAGLQIPINKLEDDHLENIITLLSKRHTAQIKFMSCLSDFILGVPRSVRETLRVAAHTISNYPPHPLYGELLNERNRRGDIRCRNSIRPW
jgi:hypothetical protein